MSTPSTSHEDAIQGAMSELMSAISALALAMAPEPIPNPAPDAPSDLDAWAKHAQEHMQAGFSGMASADHGGL